MRKKLQRELGIEISLSKYYRAKNKAKAIIDGDFREQFIRVRAYAQTIMNTNLGSCMKVPTFMYAPCGPATEVHQTSSIHKEITVFQYMYVRFAAQKQGFFLVELNQ